MKIEIPLDELLVIAEAPLRAYLKNWQNDDGNPLEFNGDLDACKIHAIGCINCEISLGGRRIMKSGPRPIPFWKYLKDESFVIKKIEIDAKEAIDGRGLTPYDFIVRINGEVVERLRKVEMSAWIGELGVELALTFVHHIFDGNGNLRELKHEKLQLDKERIKGLTFNLVKIDDIAEEE